MNQEQAPGQTELGDQILVGIVVAAVVLVAGWALYSHQKDQESAQRMERSKAYAKWVQEYQPPPPSASERQRHDQQAMEAWAACMDRMRALGAAATTSQIMSCGRLMP